GVDPALVEVVGDLGFEFGLGMEFRGRNPDDGGGDERTADGECDEGLLHEVPLRIRGIVSLMILPGQEPSGLGRSDGQARPNGQFAPMPPACTRPWPISPICRSTVLPPQKPAARRTRPAGSHPSATQPETRKAPDP